MSTRGRRTSSGKRKGRVSLQDALKPYPDKAGLRIQCRQMFESFVGLSLRIANTTKPNGTKVNLLQFVGTIPQTVSGRQFSCPIDIRIPIEYPKEEPLVHVPVPKGFVRDERHLIVDAQDGRVNYTQLEPWATCVRDGEPTLLLLILSLSEIVSAAPPLFAAPAERPAPPSQTQNLKPSSGTSASGGPGPGAAGSASTTVQRLDKLARSVAQVTFTRLTRLRAGPDNHVPAVHDTSAVPDTSAMPDTSAVPGTPAVPGTLAAAKTTETDAGAAESPKTSPDEALTRLVDARLARLAHESDAACSTARERLVILRARSAQLAAAGAAMRDSIAPVDHRRAVVARYIESSDIWLAQHQRSLQELGSHVRASATSEGVSSEHARSLLRLLARPALPVDAQAAHIAARDGALTDTLDALAAVQERAGTQGGGSDGAPGTGDRFGTYLRQVQQLAREQCTVRAHGERVSAARTVIRADMQAAVRTAEDTHSATAEPTTAPRDQTVVLDVDSYSVPTVPQGYAGSDLVSSWFRTPVIHSDRQTVPAVARTKTTDKRASRQPAHTDQQRMRMHPAPTIQSSSADLSQAARMPQSLTTTEALLSSAPAVPTVQPARRQRRLRKGATAH